jgi:cytochrome c oxidase assembly protein subunit 11
MTPMNHHQPENPQQPRTILSDHQTRQQTLIRKNARTGLAVFAVIIGMTALSFASVPLYDLFCRVTGFNGTGQSSTSFPETVLDRTVTIKFNADTGRGLFWDFKPEIREIEVKLGQKGLTAFHTTNRADTPVTGTAIYNVTPLKAGKYFHKVQCFCFDEQTLEAKQSVSMPVMFYIDPAMNDDPDMADVQTITLSYTFYKAESNELEDALEAFYNEPDPAIQGTN